MNSSTSTVINKPQILIVEDDLAMAELLFQGLTESGFRCRIAENGSEALKSTQDIDLILSDIMMPVLNGLNMVTEIRKRGIQTPVIFLTAKDQTQDIVLALEAGGDDYIVKPFKLAELLARIHAALRRANQSIDILKWQDLVLDCRTRRAERNGHQLFLSTTEFALLEYFMRNPNLVHSKATLLRSVWQDDGYRSDNIVEIYINYIRKKTETFNQAKIIHTVRGQGYVLKQPQD
jgi:DNA-binding response OmpR family regulator